MIFCCVRRSIYMYYWFIIFNLLFNLGTLTSLVIDVIFRYIQLLATLNHHRLYLAIAIASRSLQSKMINKLDSTTIHKISSGQLILDIPSTLKELIENSLDGSSTQITLTLEDEGLTSINVPPAPPN
jgi:hypothetical protein